MNLTWKHWLFIAVVGSLLGYFLPTPHLHGNCADCADAAINAAITYSIISGNP